MFSLFSLFAIDPCFDKPELSSLLARSYQYTQSAKGCFYSEALRQKVVVDVVFPKGYPFAEPIPPIYFLHGRGNNVQHFENVGGVKALDVHLKSGGFKRQPGKPMIVISPSETTHSYWRDRADGRANMAQMLNKDLTGYIDKHSKGRIAMGPARRGLAGISMGGNGALYNGCRNQGNNFAKVYAISPVIRDLEQLRSEDYPVFTGLLKSGPYDPLKQYAEFNKRDPRQFYTSTIPGGAKDFYCDYQIDYAEKDYFIEKASRTEEFLQEVAKDHPNRVRKTVRSRIPTDIENHMPVGHSKDYWKSRLPSLLRGMEKSLYPPRTSERQEVSTQNSGA